MGVAVAAEGALVVPVVVDADRLGLVGIAKRTREPAAAVRDGTVTPPEISGGTFTVSNLGMFGVSSFDAVVNPGQAAILAVGAVETRVIARDGEPVVAKVMDLTLSCGFPRSRYESLSKCDNDSYRLDAAAVSGP